MDHAIKAVPAGDGNAPGARSRELESQSAELRSAESPSAVSQELDSLFQYLVERAHDAVDRIAERAAPALGQFTENLVQGAERVGLTGDSETALADEGSRGGRSARGGEIGRRGTARQYLGIVRQHPVAALAFAVAAGIVIRQMRTR